MDKKNVQKKKAWIFYAKVVTLLHILKLWFGYQKNNYIFYYDKI
jgi:hypothetical protein